MNERLFSEFTFGRVLPKTRVRGYYLGACEACVITFENENCCGSAIQALTSTLS